MKDCKLCSDLPPPIELHGNNASDEMDKPKSHAAIHQRQLQLITGQTLSSEEIMGKCFGDVKEDSPHDASDAQFRWKNVTRPVSFACFEAYKKNGCKDIMRCLECGRDLKVKDKGRKFLSVPIREHAYTHLDKELFECSICVYKSRTKRALSHHLRKNHKKTAGIRKNYVSRANYHQEEIIATIKRCFEKQPKAEGEQENVAQPNYGKKARQMLKCPISKVCHELHKKQGCKRTMHCSICQTSLKVLNCGRFNSSKIKQHACVHLDKAFIQCRLCVYECCTHNAIRMHLEKIHKLSAVKFNYTDQSSDFEADIIATIRQCFGEVVENTPGFQIKQEDAATQIGKLTPEKRRSSFRPKSFLDKVFCEVHAKQGRKDSMACSECGKMITVLGHGRFASRRVKDHACSHMDNDVFECRSCAYKSSSLCAITCHLAGKHKLPWASQNYIDHTKTFEADIVAKIRSCFDETSHALKPKPNPQTYRLNQFTTPISTACRKLLKGKDRNSKATCSVCGKKVVVFCLGDARVNFMIDHACIHLAKKRYQCKLCDFWASGKSFLARHLKNTHHCSYTSDTCNDLSDDMNDKILDMVKRCFGTNQSSSATITTKDRLKKISNQLFEHCKRTEKVECFKCQAKVSLQGCPRGPLDHVRNHIGRPMFKCKICGFHKAVTNGCIVAHLRSNHQIRSQSMTKYEDFTDKFEQELCNMMTECFGKKGR